MPRLSRVNSATGLYLTPAGQVVVEYGSRRIPMLPAQYKANGYRPALEKLAAKPLPASKSQAARGGLRAVVKGPQR
jgi:hypothetical protein